MRRPVVLSISYLSLEPRGISTTAGTYSSIACGTTMSWSGCMGRSVHQQGGDRGSRRAAAGGAGRERAAERAGGARPRRLPGVALRLRSGDQEAEGGVGQEQGAGAGANRRPRAQGDGFTFRRAHPGAVGAAEVDDLEG